MAAPQTATFAEHIQELRTRLMWSLLFVAVGAGLGYALHEVILSVLQRPLNDTLYYTTPGGAFSFIIKICVAFGFVVALPMVVYQIFGFFGPLLPLRTRRMFVGYVLATVMLAALGIVFAYFISLPSALHFLVNFGNDKGSIEALITADEYFNFVLTYIAGFAVLFQLPLIIVFINKVTPLPPHKLLGISRYAILGSFIISAIITPTPDPLNQTLMAGPIILLFFLSVLLVAVINRGRGKAKNPVENLAIPDEVFEFEKQVPVEPEPRPLPIASPAPAPIASAPVPVPRPVSRRLVTDMVVPGRGRTVSAYKPRPVVHQPAVQPERRHPVRLISDFIPAHE